MKIGDKVKILGKTFGAYMSGSPFSIGDIGKIKSIETWKKSEDTITLEGEGNTVFYKSDLELVEKTMFKVGDKVRVLGKSVESSISQCPKYNIGDIDTINEIKKEDIYLTKDNFYVFITEDLELVEDNPMFKKGDRVKILSKSIGSSINAVSMNIGDIGEIKSVNLEDFCVGINDGYGTANFLKKDLELVEEEKMEYEIKGSWNLIDVAIFAKNSSTNCEEFQRLWNKLNSKSGTIWAFNNVTYKLFEVIEKNIKPARGVKILNYLEEYGFIKKVEIVYECGDVFEDQDGNKYIVTPGIKHKTNRALFGIKGSKKGKFINCIAVEKSCITFTKSELNQLSEPVGNLTKVED